MKRKNNVLSEYEESEYSEYGGPDDDHPPSQATNKIYLRGNITADGIDRFLVRFHKLQSKLNQLEFNTGAKFHIELFIDSEGGEVHPALKLYDAIKRSRIPVWTIIDGYCASAGTIISLAGHRRLITPSSFFLIHQVSCWIGGSLKRLKESVKNTERVQSTLTKIYSENLNLTKEKLKKLLETDQELNAEEAIRIGLCTDYYD